MKVNWWYLKKRCNNKRYRNWAWKKLWKTYRIRIGNRCTKKGKKK